MREKALVRRAGQLGGNGQEAIVVTTRLQIFLTFQRLSPTGAGDFNHSFSVNFFSFIYE